MKTQLNFDKVNNIMLELKGESWPYLAALVAVLLLAIILIASVITNSYLLISTGIASRENIIQISKLHELMTRHVAMQITTTTDYLSLFGTAPPVNPASYILMGIEYSIQNPSAAKAIISNNNNQKIYGVGEKLPQGGVVNSINTDHVMILNNGVSEKLILKWEPLTPFPTEQQ